MDFALFVQEMYREAHAGEALVWGAYLDLICAWLGDVAHRPAAQPDHHHAAAPPQILLRLGRPAGLCAGPLSRPVGDVRQLWPGSGQGVRPRLPDDHGKRRLPGTLRPRADPWTANRLTPFAPAGAACGGPPRWTARPRAWAAI